MPLPAFVFTGLPVRVLFGRGSRALLAEEAERLGMRRVMLLSTPGRVSAAEELRGLLAGRCAGTFSGARAHTPKDITAIAVAAARDAAVDGVVAIGGGSTTGLAKALSHRLGMRQIILPTTYSGSEMTPILGETEKGVKTTFRDPKLQPDSVIYDVELMRDLPASFAVASGVNAMAHAVEASYAKDRNPIISQMAETALAVLAGALPGIVAHPADLDAREAALYGACLSGLCLGSVGMALHHKLCHTLGGAFDLPHAETHALMLPYALAFNKPAIPEPYGAISRALGSARPEAALQRLSRSAGLAGSLRQLGLEESALEGLADAATSSAYWNPRTASRDDIRAILQRAWRGDELG